MDNRTETRVLWLLAAALALFGFGAPYKLHEMPAWLPNLALLLALFCALWGLLIWLPAPAKGRKKTMAAILIAVGACALIFGVVLYLDPTLEADNDYMYFWADNPPANTPGQFPIHVASPCTGAFRDLRVWWAPWGSQSKPQPKSPDNPYWSIGFSMKSPVNLIRGGADYGRSISPGDYSIEYDATLREVNYHFDEHLIIENKDGKLVQKIDVWRTVVPGGEKILVYSGSKP